MRILFLAPQPFFQERGTPIAVRMALEVLRKRPNTEVDLLVYHEGEDIPIEHVTIYRSWRIPGIRNVGAGLSWKKLLCDLFFAGRTISLFLRSCLSGKRYDVIHAVEESAFIALFLNLLSRTPFLYDMDSSLSLQVVEKVPALKIAKPLFEFLEKSVIRKSLSVVPVCDALAVIALSSGAKTAQVLHDFSLLTSHEELPAEGLTLRQEANISDTANVALYVGNLERYQGIDLLLAAWKTAMPALTEWHIVIIGGSEAHRANYSATIQKHGLTRVHLLGGRPTRLLGHYLKQADILLSPRIEGNNTPMKLYSYLHAGVATLATNLFTHTQVLTSEIAMLCDPTPEALAKNLVLLGTDAELRRTIGAEARLIAQEKFTFERFEKTLNTIYDEVEVRLLQDRNKEKLD